MSTSLEHQRLAEKPHQRNLKLLLPMDATERSRWGIHYAKSRRQSGFEVAVSLLLVAEPVTNWEVLRFFSQERVRRFQTERGKWLLEDAARALEQARIPVQMNYREGNIVFEILDCAEQLECDEIVLPLPHLRCTRFFYRDIVREVVRRQRAVPVTTVNSEGMPERYWQH